MELTQILAHDTTPEGEELLLVKRDSVFTLRIDGMELMTSRAHASEDAVARLACESLPKVLAPRVLVGGLGFGYTLRAALDHLPPDSTVVVCELFELLIVWNQGVLGDLAGRPLDDQRVTPVQADVRSILVKPETYHAIILDVDNGPWGFTLQSNDELYSAAGVDRIRKRLQPGGVLAVWSSQPSEEFADRLESSGFSVAVQAVAAELGHRRVHHTIFVGVREH